MMKDKVDISKGKHSRVERKQFRHGTDIEQIAGLYVFIAKETVW